MTFETPNPEDGNWWLSLSDEDRSFIKRFVLASGSLKDLAAAYEVSYPTVRLRLDRVIQKIQILEDSRIRDSFERALRSEYGDGKIDSAAFKRLLSAYQKQVGKPRP